jgi:hypothetical protein
MNFNNHVNRYLNWCKKNSHEISSKSFEYYCDTKLRNKVFKYKREIVKSINKQFNFFVPLSAFKNNGIKQMCNREFSSVEYLRLYRYCRLNYYCNDIVTILLFIFLFNLRLSEIKHLNLSHLQKYVKNQYFYIKFRKKIVRKYVPHTSFNVSFIKYVQSHFTLNRADNLIFIKSYQCYREKFINLQRKLFPLYKNVTFSEIRSVGYIVANDEV